MTHNENITRAEARDRSSRLATRSYEVALDLSTEGPTFSSTTIALFDCNEPGSSTWIDLIAESVHSVELNGRALDVSDVVDGARIRLDGLESTNTVRIAADCVYMNTGEGLHRFVDPVDKETDRKSTRLNSSH